MVFPLFSWVTQRRPLAEWLGDALNEQYDVSRKLVQAWVDTDQLLPLLAGLDEVALEHRTACVEAMNTFRQDHGLLPLVVCSRIVDYEALGTRLRLQGALDEAAHMNKATSAMLRGYDDPYGQLNSPPVETT